MTLFCAYRYTFLSCAGLYFSPPSYNWVFSCVQGFANILSDDLNTLGIAAEVIDMEDYDPDDQLTDEVRKSKRGAYIMKKILRCM